MRSLVIAASLVALSFLGTSVADHPQPAGSRTTAFDHKTGNEWWVEVRVSGSPSAVEARDTDGAWKALTLRSWGAWAASFHIEPGHRVQFRASWSDGASAESCWFTHPQGVEQCDSGPDPGPEPGAFTFAHEGGNEWWVEVDIEPRPEAVEAMDTGGSWKALTLRSWGNWAGSFHVEPGHEVKFRARGDGGAFEESCWYAHPEGVARCADPEPDPDPDPTPTESTFTHEGGNEWWVEVDIEPRPEAVEAMDTGGSWKALTLRSWGNWAGSIHIEPGHDVKFRARTSGGAVHESCWFTHPEGVEQPCGDDGEDTTGAWPREGSYIRYFLDSGTSLPGYSDDQLVWLNYTYTGGAWRGTCEGWDITWTEYGGEEVERIPTTAAAAPPLGGPATAQPGESRTLRIPACAAATTSAFVDERWEISTYHGTEPFLQNGTPVTIPVWLADWEDDGCPCQYRQVAWHPDTGLTIDYAIGYRYSYESGHLVDTDAPVSKAQTKEPPKPAWPKEGSFVTYRVQLSSEYSDAVEEVDVRFAYAGGKWQMACTGDRPEVGEESPPMGPAVTDVGALVRPTEAAYCGITPPPVVVQGKFPQDTMRNGAYHRAEVWWGDERDDDQGDEDAWWDTRTGLLLKWEDKGGYYQGDVGWLTDTDAPLSSR